ncbi:hypothetical protein [uncultured Psychrobacter sp.]|uniref:hypothetical protein n=1 Tax=uncultured Psychrobacter sp. TaxID=259303 RepID=UPI0030DA590F
MTFSEKSTSFSKYLEFLKTKFNLNVSTAFGIDTESEAETLKSLSDNHIVPVHNGYPTVYSFNDIGGISYILVRGGASNDSTLFAVPIENSEDAAADNDVSEHINDMMQLRGINLCEWFVLSELSLWQVEHDTYTTLSIYGLSDLIPQVHDDSGDEDVAIWVEYHYNDKHDKPVWGEYLRGSGATNIIFPSKKEADAMIASMQNTEYLLSPNELARPTYFVTL